MNDLSPNNAGNNGHDSAPVSEQRLRVTLHESEHIVVLDGELVSFENRVKFLIENGTINGQAVESPVVVHGINEAYKSVKAHRTYYLKDAGITPYVQ